MELGRPVCCTTFVTFALAFSALLHFYGGCSALQCKIAADPKDPAAGVSPNTTIKLTCIAIGELAESSLWYRDGALIPNVSQTNPSALIIPAVHGSNNNYQCTVKKGEMTQQCTRRLKVNVYGKPVINKIGRIWNIFYFETLAIPCAVKSGWPEPTLEWRVIGSGEGSFTVKRERDELILQREASILTEMQIYRWQCTATNKFGTASVETKVAILDTNEVPVNPKVTSPASHVLAYAGQNVTLTCFEKNACTEDKPRTVTWRHNETTKYVSGICEDGRLRIQLLRTNVSLNDVGAYRCEVRFDGDSDWKTIQLILVSKGFLSVQAASPHKEVRVGEDVTMECVTTYPYLATLGEFWTLNGAPLGTTDERYTRKHSITSDRYAVHNKTDGMTLHSAEFSLTIHNVTQRDMGLYECGVNTTLGIKKGSVQLRERTPTSATSSPKQGLRRMRLIALTVGSATTGFIVIIAMAAAYYKRKAKGITKKGVLKPALPFKYDVFVTFSGKDGEWVEEELVPVLEKSDLKFCIHNRDFELGKPFVDNMIDSIYSSRKVLAIVSENYMASSFCRGELDMALQRSVEENAETSLVLLRLDSVLKSKLPKVLRGKTFLDYHDPEGRCNWASRLATSLSEEEGKELV